MGIVRELSDEEFEGLSFTGKKKHVANLLIKRSKATSIPNDQIPIAIVMAGVPGSGKTEFLNTFSNNISSNKFELPVRIDLDEIVEVFPGYTAKTASKFRSKGNTVLAHSIDTAKAGRYNMMIDGTFSGDSGVSITNVSRLLECGYIVFMFFMHDKVETSWEYTVAREKETDRGIGKSEFIKSCGSVVKNLKQALEQFYKHENFSFRIAVQQELRSEQYTLIEDKEVIDGILSKGYNIDKLKELL